METSPKDEVFDIKLALKTALKTFLSCFIGIMFVLSFIFVVSPRFSLKINNTLGFKKVKELGFSTVELSQVEMTSENVEAIKSALEEFDMKVCATSAALKPMAPGMKMENLKDDFDKIVADTKALGCKYIRIGMISFDCLG
jgi:hypothetical protein